MSLRKENKILVLLGAGASHKSGIPTSPKMIQKLENLLKSKDTQWNKFQRLYFYIKSAIYYADGITGKFDNSVNYNIERLVNTLSELERKVDHPLYPFIGNWNIKLVELGGEDFLLVQDFRQRILEELQNDWVLIEDYTKSSYYQGLFNFAKEYQYPLRVFSLNYDMCLERNVGNALLERGFSDGRIWDWKNFDESESEKPNIFLYKLHGSIDWFRDEQKNLTFSDEPAKIRSDQLEIIFGTNYKLQYTDPFLFYVYEFRRWTLEAKLIISIGYGFGDEHINGILSQALLSNTDPNEKKLLAVSTFSNGKENEAEERLLKTLNIQNKDQLEVKKNYAEDFISEGLKMEKLNELFPIEEELFEDI